MVDATSTTSTKRGVYRRLNGVALIDDFHDLEADARDDADLLDILLLPGLHGDTQH